MTNASADSVFVDASAFYALADRSDGRHREARIAQERIIRGGWRLWTSNFVMAEAHALIVKRRGRRFGLAFLESLRSGAISVVRVQEADEERAFLIITGYQDKDFSFTDATSFAVMERLGLRSAFSFDGDFRQYGWNILA